MTLILSYILFSYLYLGWLIATKECTLNVYFLAAPIVLPFIVYYLFKN